MTFTWVAYDWLGANQRLFGAINGGLPLHLQFLAHMGSAVGNYWAAPAVFAALLGWSRRARSPDRSDTVRRQAYLFGLSFLLAFGLAALLKWGVDMPRPRLVLGSAVRLLAPEEARHGFPSGHSVYAILVALALWPLSVRPVRAALIVGVLWVGASRIALGAHFPADVAGGWLLALACYGAATLLQRWLAGLQQGPPAPVAQPPERRTEAKHET